MSDFWAEFIGTMILIILGDGVVAGVVLKQTKSFNGGWVVITLAWGIAVTMAIYAVGNFSGAHINPAVTIGFAAYGSLPWAKVPLYIIAQVLGAFTGGVIVWLHYLPHWKKTEDPAAKLAVFATGPAVRSSWSNLLSETIGTFVLVTGLLFIGANEFTEGLNPIVVGALIVVIGMSLGGTTGYAINPARDLGPRIAHQLLPIHGKGDSDWGYALIPIAGPILGGVLGTFFYKAAFKLQIGIELWGAMGIFLVVVIFAIRKEMREGRR